MKKSLSLLVVLLSCLTSYGQNKFQAIVLDKESKQPQVAVHILFEDLKRGSITNFEGVLNLYDLPEGRHEGKILAFDGYEEEKFFVTLPQKTPLVFYLTPKTKKRKNKKRNQ